MNKKTKRFTALLLSLLMLFSSSPFASAADTEQAGEETGVVRVQEEPSLRTTNSETYLLSSGGYECVVYAEDKYYYDDSNTLQAIDNSIQAQGPTAGTVMHAPLSTIPISTVYKNAANSFDVTFSSSGVPEISIDLDGKSIRFSPLDASGGSGNHIVAEDCVIRVGEVENCAALDYLTDTGSNSATYENAFSGADLVYTLENSALKEYIILESSSAPNAFSFLFELEGLTLQTAEGFHYFADSSGNSVFSLGSLFAVDANGKPTDALSYTFTPVKGTTDQIIVTVTLDEAYLFAADRAYPVVIDPSKFRQYCRTGLFLGRNSNGARLWRCCNNRHQLYCR